MPLTASSYRSEEIIAASETGEQFGELGPPLVWLRPLQTGSWQEQADPGNAVGTGKGQDNGRGHCLLSAAKLTAIVHYACWGRYLPQKKGCRLSISSPFSHFFNTLSDRLAIANPAS